LPGGGAERGFDIEQVRFWVCRQRLCDGAHQVRCLSAGCFSDLSRGFLRPAGRRWECVRDRRGRWSVAIPAWRRRFINCLNGSDAVLVRAL
jgi:hypothetical protein